MSRKRDGGESAAGSLIGLVWIVAAVYGTAWAVHLLAEAVRR